MILTIFTTIFIASSLLTFLLIGRIIYLSAQRTLLARKHKRSPMVAVILSPGINDTPATFESYLREFITTQSYTTLHIFVVLHKGKHDSYKTTARRLRHTINQPMTIIHRSQAPDIAALLDRYSKARAVLWIDTSMKLGTQAIAYGLAELYGMKRPSLRFRGGCRLDNSLIKTAVLQISIASDYSRVVSKKTENNLQLGVLYKKRSLYRKTIPVYYSLDPRVYFSQQDFSPAPFSGLEITIGILYLTSFFFLVVLQPSSVYYLMAVFLSIAILLGYNLHTAHQSMSTWRYIGAYLLTPFSLLVSPLFALNHSIKFIVQKNATIKTPAPHSEEQVLLLTAWDGSVPVALELFQSLGGSEHDALLTDIKNCRAECAPPVHIEQLGRLSSRKSNTVLKNTLTSADRLDDEDLSHWNQENVVSLMRSSVTVLVSHQENALIADMRHTVVCHDSHSL